MSAKLKSLVLVSIFAVSAFTSAPAAESATKKRKARATGPVAPSAAVYNGGMVAPGGIPRWVQYDQGGMYYYTKNELEKARQYWLAALKIAEQVVPLEKSKGLSGETEKHVCDLISHLVMFVSDSKLNTHGSIYSSQGNGGLSVANASSSSDPQRVAYDNMTANLKQIRDDRRWFERIMVFAERTVGKDNRCLGSMKGTRAQMDISETNCKYLMSNIEKELNIRRSSVDSRPTNGSSGLSPTGEYVPPGQTP